MSKLVFYEKPGCDGNQRQTASLCELGYELAVRDLLKETWTPRSLLPYFANMPVVEWFNLSAPMIQSGEIAIDELSEQQALALMILEPVLIRRPLMQLGEIRQAGFEAGPVLDTLGVLLDPEHDLQYCPMTDSLSACEASS
jgi:nitrogenase-associated protein